MSWETPDNGIRTCWINNHYGFITGGDGDRPYTWFVVTDSGELAAQGSTELLREAKREALAAIYNEDGERDLLYNVSPSETRTTTVTTVKVEKIEKSGGNDMKLALWYIEKIGCPKRALKVLQAVITAQLALESADEPVQRDSVASRLRPLLDQH